MKNVCAFLLLLSSVFAVREGLKYKKRVRSDFRNFHTISNANNKFAVSLFKTVTENSDDNAVMSPISIELSLGLAYLGARGHTAQQMAEGLHIPQDNLTMKIGFRHLLGALRSTKDMDLEIANNVYLQSSFNILKDFRRAARKIFMSDVRELNFDKKPEKAARIINSWVEKRTKQKITKIIEEGTIRPATKLILVNAVYLKAEWEMQFNSEDTKQQEFHIITGETVSVPMMEIKTEFGFKTSEELGAKILELPYKGEAASMFVLLPDAEDGIDNLESKLPEVDLAALFTNFSKEEILVKLPKFRAESSIKLRPYLEELGFKDMFDGDRADLSGITGQQGLVVSSVLHKAFVDVTELGTEAGASTAIVIESRMWRPPPSEFVADHPFVFVIWHKKINTALFMGRLMMPQ